MNSSLPAPPEWDLLLSAAQKNDSNRIRFLIEKNGVDPNHANHVGQSAVHIASLWGNVEALETLLGYSKDNVNACNRLNGATPLHCAAQSFKGKIENRIKCIEVLLREENHADPSICDFYEKTPQDYVQIPKTQKKDGSTGGGGGGGGGGLFNPVGNNDNNNSNTKEEELQMKLYELLQPKLPPIITAIQEEQLDTLQSIIQTDPSIVLQGKYKGQIPLVYALNHTLQIMHIDDDDDADDDDNTKDTVASLSTLLDIFKILVAATRRQTRATTSTTTSTTTSSEQSFLNALNAAISDRPANPTSVDIQEEPLVQICRALQSTFRQINQLQQPPPPPASPPPPPPPQQQQQQPSPLQLINHKIQVLETMAKLLVNAATGTNIVSTSIVNMLLDASRRNEIQMVRFCIQDLMIDPNTPGRQGMTSLQFAARSGTTQIVHYLLSLPNINIHTKDDHGHSPLDAARTNNKQEIVQLLEQYNNQQQTQQNK